MSLPESLERAASELSALADQIRPANGDPHRLLEELNAEEAGRLLGWILREEPDAAEELILVWGEVDAGAEILMTVSDEGVAKVGRKLLRKARHRLRSQGIEIKSPEQPVQSSRRATVVANDRWQVAHLSVPDFRGGRVGYLVDSHPAGGARLFEIRFDEARGILDFKLYNAGRSKVRGFLRSLTAGTGHRLFEVGREPLRALVRRASLAQPIDRPLPTSFVEWRSRLFSDELDDEQTPGDLVRSALGSSAGDGPDAGDASSSLDTTLTEIRAGELGPWPPKTAWVSDWMAQGSEATEGLEGKPRAVAIESWLEQVAESLGKETESKRLARNLDEMAWIRWQSENESGARNLLSVSDSISNDEDAMRRMSRAQSEGIFSAFLAKLRVVEISAFDDSDADTQS
jgi:hypothetical protein